MDGDSEFMLLRILSLCIEDCLGCKGEHLKFSQADNVHLLLYSLDKTDDAESSTMMTVTPVGHALQLLCDSQFNAAGSLQRIPLLTIGKGMVGMSFTVQSSSSSDAETELDMRPSTSKQAEERRNQRRTRTHTVNVVRRFDDVHALERVDFQIDRENWQEMNISKFQSMFFVQPQHDYELLQPEQLICAKNWLKVIQADAYSYDYFRNSGNPFDSFAKLFQRQDYKQHELLEKLATNCLAVNEATRLTERRFVLSIFERVRFIFEYITINEYTVWFFVPRLNRYTTLEQVDVDDFDLSNVRTSIKLTRDTSEFFWHHADHNIMDILLVSFQLALAQVAKQSVLFVGRMEKLSKFVCMQYIMASFMNSVHGKERNSDKWVCPRYLQRIIELADTLNVVVFVEYPSGLTLLPENRHVIRCIQHRDKNTDNLDWNVFEDVTEKVDSGIESVKDALNIPDF